MHQLRERRFDRNWRIIRQTSMISTGVVLTILLVLDGSFLFESWRLNVTIVLLTLFFAVLSRIDLFLHKLVLQIRERRRLRDKTL